MPTADGPRTNRFDGLERRVDDQFHINNIERARRIYLRGQY